MMMPSGLSWLGFGDHQIVTERQCLQKYGSAERMRSERQDFTGRRVYLKNIMRNVSNSETQPY